MSKRLVAVLLSLPALAMGASASFAATTQLAADAPSASAPAADRVAMPAGCSGCAGHDCANCPLLRAAAEQGTAQPAGVTEIHCGTN
jgi:hypothetical protein